MGPYGEVALKRLPWSEDEAVLELRAAGQECTISGETAAGERTVMTVSTRLCRIEGA